MSFGNCPKKASKSQLLPVPGRKGKELPRENWLPCAYVCSLMHLDVYAERVWFVGVGVSALAAGRAVGTDVMETVFSTRPV